MVAEKGYSILPITAFPTLSFPNISNLGIIFVLLHLMHHVPRLLIFTQQSVLEMRLAFVLSSVLMVVKRCHLNLKRACGCGLQIGRLLVVEATVSPQVSRQIQ